MFTGRSSLLSQRDYREVGGEVLSLLSAGSGEGCVRHGTRSAAEALIGLFTKADAELLMQDVLSRKTCYIARGELIIAQW